MERTARFSLGEEDFPQANFVNENPNLITEVVDLALEGSEYAVEAWQLLKKILRDDRNPTGEEIERLDELVDRARDDIKGPGLRIDFSKERIY